MAIAVSEAQVAPTESAKTAVSWAAIVAGAFAAATLTVVLVLLGSGLGLSMVSPWSGGAGLTAVAVSTAVWLVVVQWLSSGVGGYLAGRLRTRWVNVHTDEVFFRDSAHGFLAWALATLLVVGVLGSALSSIVGVGGQAAATVTSGVALGATAAAGSAAADSDTASAGGSYFVDTLFRPADPARLATPAGDNASASGEAARILAESVAAGQVSAEDRIYLSQLVAARTGLSPADAEARVDAVLSRVEAAKTQAKEAADSARKAGATFALLSALSLAVGAFIASAAAALGGRQRDDDEDTVIIRR
jgi:uncharacterized membrane protein